MPTARGSPEDCVSVCDDDAALKCKIGFSRAVFWDDKLLFWHFEK